MQTLRKVLQTLEKWSTQIAFIEALLTIGSCPSPKPVLSPVKMDITHEPASAAISKAPFIVPDLHSSDPVVGPDESTEKVSQVFGSQFSSGGSVPGSGSTTCQ